MDLLLRMMMALMDLYILFVLRSHLNLISVRFYLICVVRILRTKMTQN